MLGELLQATVETAFGVWPKLFALVAQLLDISRI
jgi:hypothetical protein